MPNKCSLVNCRSGYKPRNGKAIEDVHQPVFHFPKEDDPELRKAWMIKFINRKDWVPSKYDGVCIKHFDLECLLRGETRTKLKRNLRPVPTCDSLYILANWLEQWNILYMYKEAILLPTLLENCQQNAIIFFLMKLNISTSSMLF